MEDSIPVRVQLDLKLLSEKELKDLHWEVRFEMNRRGVVADPEF